MMKRTTRTYTPSLVFLAAIMLLLTACGEQLIPTQVTVMPTNTPTPTPSARGSGGTLRLLNWDAPVILNPHLTLSTKDLEASRITYEPLASVDKEGVLIPFLAAEIPTLENGGLAADGKSVTWKLKRGVKWSDGEPFTAADVRFTYEYITNPDVASTSGAVGLYAAITDVEVIDDYTVKIHFADVNPAWALPFVGVQGVILPRHIFEPYNGANAMEAPANMLPVGTGPYRVVPPGIKPQEVLLLGTQIVETNKIVFEPNPYFREADKPYFSKIELRGGGTINEAARLCLETGDVDYAFALQLPPEDLARFETATQGKLISNFGSAVERILLNRTDPNRETASGERSSLEFPHPFFSDKKVRQAFAYAIDRASIAELYGPAGKPTYNNLIAPPQYASPNTFYEYNPAQAQKLLDEAGWRDTDNDGIRDKDGMKMQVVIEYEIKSIYDQVFLVLKKNLNAIGVEIIPKRVDASVMSSADPASTPDNWLRFNADMIMTWYFSDPDPGPYMQIWTSYSIPQQANNWSAGGNVERWYNPAYDALYEQSATEIDPKRRQQLFIQMNDMLIEDVVMIPLVHMADVAGVNNTLTGIDLTPWDTNTWNIKDWRRSP
ncbi:MAG TPA: peptide ABC transporter substrate-binding protein [Anaerolineae bacterium]|nr:peptide ABC transporter substrate-binding protein [Anaerolineae bacterium]HQK12797.1 peptide ABC transporter substrate-binding protein [Anaerolineae bacterium]